MSRKTIGENPLDVFISNKEEVKSVLPTKKKPIPPNNKKRLTVQISEDIIERSKDAVYWTRGLTLAQFTEKALEEAVKSLEQKSVVYDDTTGKPLKNKGNAFPKRKGGLKTGRPVK